MDRRTFSQRCVGGAAALSLLASGAGDANACDDTPATKTDGNPPRENAPAISAEPVAVAEYEALARAKLPRPTFDYISTGSADECTLRDNIAAFQRIKILPPLLRGVSTADLSTTVLGHKISLPIMLAPVSSQRLFHPQGALAASRAATNAGTIYCVSSSVCHSVEEIAQQSPGSHWFQLYVPKDRAVTKRLVERVERAGYRAIIVTVDLGEWKDADRRNRFNLPREMLVKHLRDIGFSQVNDRMSYEEVVAFNAQAWDLSLSWDFFGWLRGVTKLPLLIKGVLRPDDAKTAVRLGLDGIVVSNHGGRRLDGMPASIDMLPGVAEAVGGKIELYLDGGIRRGTDVLKAIALGAKAVLIGRPYAWALAANGEAGVRHVIELLRSELVNAMIATGCPTIGDINRSLLMLA